MNAARPEPGPDHRLPNPARAPRRGLLAARIGLVVVLSAVLAGCASTTVSGLRVRAGPTTHSGIVAVLPRADTTLRITCQSRGEPVHGTRTWYRITTPHSGYVSGHYVRNDRTVPPTC